MLPLLGFIITTSATVVGLLKNRRPARRLALALGLGLFLWWALFFVFDPRCAIPALADLALIPLLLRHRDRGQLRQMLSLLGVGSLVPVLLGSTYVGLMLDISDAWLVAYDWASIVFILLLLGASAALLAAIGLALGKSWGVLLTLSAASVVAVLGALSPWWADSSIPWPILAVPAVLLLLSTAPFWKPIFRFLRESEED